MAFNSHLTLLIYGTKINWKLRRTLTSFENEENDDLNNKTTC